MKATSILYFSCFTVSLVLLCSCRNKVTITRSYIYSASWANGAYQGFRIAKIKLLDTTVSVSNKDFNRFQLDKHTIDSSFCFGVVSKEETRTRREKKFFLGDQTQVCNGLNVQMVLSESIK